MNRTVVVTVCLTVVALATAVMCASPVIAAPGLTPKESLGKSIFYDSHLSLNQNQSCATCHAPESGWTGSDASVNASGAVYEGSVAGRFGDHKPPSSAYATFSPVLDYSAEQGLFVGGNFWNGRATGEKLGNPAADQAQGPFLNPAEQALPDSACVVYRVCNSAADYAVGFDEVWGSDACTIDWPAEIETACQQDGGTITLTEADRAAVDSAFDQVALSIAAFEASSESNAFTSKYDYFLEGKVNFTHQERMGMMMFMGMGRCATCHSLAPGPEGQHPLLTDFSYRNVGLPKNPENPVYTTDAAYVDQGLGGFLAGQASYASYSAENIGKQKVPSLRNVDLRPSPDFVKAYGHNGYFKTLEGIVHFYNTRDVKPLCAGDYTEAEALAADCWPAAEVADNLATVVHGMMGMSGGMNSGMGMGMGRGMGMNGSMGMSRGMGMYRGMMGMGMMGMGRELGNLGLTPAQEAAIVAFLKTLSDGYPLATAPTTGTMMH